MVLGPQIAELVPKLSSLLEKANVFEDPNNQDVKLPLEILRLPRETGTFNYPRRPGFEIERIDQ